MTYLVVASLGAIHAQIIQGVSPVWAELTGTVINGDVTSLYSDAMANSGAKQQGVFRQGDGFYKLCERLYSRPWQDLKVDKNFEIERIKKCYAFWKDNDNYKQFRDDF